MIKIVSSPFNSTSASVKVQSVRFLHIPRETNSVADQPAKDNL